jgi:hypothetical protein
MTERWKIGMKIAVLMGLLCSPVLVYADTQPAATKEMQLETFQEDQVGTFPARWKVRGDEAEARKIYKVAEENGEHFLHAFTRAQGVQIGLERAFKPQEFPILRWRWRARQLPPGADDRKKDTNDSAAAIYVIFDSRMLPRVLKYVWSSTLPVGTRIDNPVYWRAKTVVLESGSAAVGEWREETVNVYQDYKELFGIEPGDVQGIGILTDSDMTGTVAEADYADFVLLAAEPAAGKNSHSAAARSLSVPLGSQ